jgi:hypothetical protein
MRLRVLLTLALTLGAVAMTAGPAGAKAPAAASLECAPETTALGVLTAAATARGGGDQVREPSSSETASEVPDSDKGKGGPNFKATVPVWFHVVHDGPIANLTQEQIDAQMTVLNRDYAGFEGGVNTGFKFKLVGVTRTDNGEWLRHGYGDKTERDMKRALHQGGRETLNIYSTEASIYLGWAYFPNLSDSRLYLDGVVVDWESMLGTSTRYAGRYDEGETLVHEAGHWLNLYHTFQGGCNAKGDYVDDTPFQKVPTSGCPEGKDTCSEPGLDPIHNYMDYSYDSCYTEFTAGQAARMQDAWLFFRA